MDGEQQGRDLVWQNIHRELQKLVSGFTALGVRTTSNGEADSADLPENDTEGVALVLPPWGCGAFGGDFHIKLLLIWTAASVCHHHVRELRLAVRRDWWEELHPDWRTLLDRLKMAELDQTWSILCCLANCHSESPPTEICWRDLWAD